MSKGLRSPATWLDGPNRQEAVRSVTNYMSGYGGRYFEPLAAVSDPNAFEATDIAAVSCLSVTIPAETVGWLLLGKGRRQTSALLKEMAVGRSVPLQDHDLAANPAANALWEVLSKRYGLGPTKVSKLISAKRPHLVPIYDTYVADALLEDGGRGRWQWWGPWREAVTGPDGDRLRASIEEVRIAAAALGADLTDVSDLRVLDIVIWSAEDRRRRQSPPTD